jgi:ABC-type multidrug transport system permease subunit
MRLVASREEAQDLVRSKRAGSALVIPAGTQAALDEGAAAAVLLLIDSVKYLERINVRSRLLEMRDEIFIERQQRFRLLAGDERERLRTEVDRLRARLEALRNELDASREAVITEQQAAVARVRSLLQTAQKEARERLSSEIDAAGWDLQRTIEAEIRQWQRPLREYADTLRTRRADFDRWLAELREMAGRRASAMPAPPAFPEPPPALRALLDSDVVLRLPTPRPVTIALPPPPRIELPPVPTPPAIEVPDFALPAVAPVLGQLTIREVDVSGGKGSINTFDQNVPGFSVTFLLLGMLLGVSLGLLDERDWGTLERLRAMPVPLPSVLAAKLCSRFLIGFVQMIVLLAVGWLAFRVSLGPEPWALLLPIAGIVFAGTAFGLIVAAVAPSREAVLPVGSIVIVTMAAVGGCWWPIDLEPRWMRSVALAFPTTWAMDAFNDLMIRQRPARAALRPTAVMFAYGILYLALGLALFWRRTVRR